MIPKSVLTSVVLAAIATTSSVSGSSRTNTAPVDSRNCYAYAIGYDVGVNPGDLGGGPRFTRQDLTPSAIIARAERDGLVLVSEPDDCPTTSRPVAAVLGPRDYHWYRRDDDGMWSHKRGLDPVVRRTDVAGTPIPAPQTVAVTRRSLGSSVRAKSV